MQLFYISSVFSDFLIDEITGGVAMSLVANIFKRQVLHILDELLLPLILKMMASLSRGFLNIVTSCACFSAFPKKRVVCTFHYRIYYIVRSLHYYIDILNGHPL